MTDMLQTMSPYKLAVELCVLDEGAPPAVKPAAKTLPPAVRRVTSAG